MLSPFKAIKQRHKADDEIARERREKLNKGILPEDLKDTTMDAPGAQVQPAMPKPGAPTAPRMIPLVRQVVPQPIVPIAMNRPTPMAVPVRPVGGVLIRGTYKSLYKISRNFI